MKTNKLAFFLLLLTCIHKGYSQCAMCKAVVENGDAGLAKGLNDGIVTLMLIPYILVALVAFAFWRYYKKNKKA